jgi:hypothetical protein
MEKGAQRELWVVESVHVPTQDGWHPLLFGIGLTEKHARYLANKHPRDYPKEPCRVVRKALAMEASEGKL